ncbi:TIM23 complex component [Gaertneriomyces sp. JEL0708]|nr:TIM23 complex component [Gaertneriomyces sp. JEL0708]
MWERVGGTLGGTGGFVGGAYYFAAVAEFDPTQQLFGDLSPMVVYPLGAVAVALAGTVGGILVGGLSWRAAKGRETLQALDSRDREFFRRIQRHRPAEIAMAMPFPGGKSAMPDYYGEKINSVADYRDWLKKQRKFKVARLTLGDGPQ